MQCPQGKQWTDLQAPWGPRANPLEAFLQLGLQASSHHCCSPSVGRWSWGVLLSIEASIPQTPQIDPVPGAVVSAGPGSALWDCLKIIFHILLFYGLL